MEITRWMHRIALVSLLGLALGACSGGRSPGDYFHDKAITAKVKSALLNDEQVGALDIQVQAHMGVLQLSGTVDTYEEVARAEEVAKGVKGVSGVRNDILLK